MLAMSEKEKTLNIEMQEREMAKTYLNNHGAKHKPGGRINIVNASQGLQSWRRACDYRHPQALVYFREYKPFQRRGVLDDDLHYACRCAIIITP